MNALLWRLAAAALLLPGAVAHGTATTDAPFDVLRHAHSQCMLDLGAAGFFLRTDKLREAVGLEAEQVTAFRSTWRQYNALLTIAADGAPGWDKDALRSAFTRQHETYWQTFLVEDGSGYRASAEQRAAIAAAAIACHDGLEAAQLRALAVRQYQRYGRCYAVARPLHDEMQRNPDYAAGLELSLAEVANVVTDAWPKVESQARTLGRNATQVSADIDVHYRAFWDTPGTDADPLGNRILGVLEQCRADAALDAAVREVVGTE